MIKYHWISKKENKLCLQLPLKACIGPNFSSCTCQKSNSTKRKFYAHVKREVQMLDLTSGISGSRSSKDILDSAFLSPVLPSSPRWLHMYLPQMTASVKLCEMTASGPSMKLTILELCSSKRGVGGGYPLESILEICGDGWGCHGDGGELLFEFHARHPMEHGALLYKEEFLCSMPVSNVPLDIHVGRTPIYNELSLDLTPFYI